ncbi:phosphoribosyl-ATP pyrophosphohydrolase [Methanomicrobium antiquum]|uniref:Phosphoribosyl-ATP pyrophosphohydrolase n=1 Tax=Methanomicrobium antiquum TaxID=487686 RepID=A0AAF0FKI0_9EURY|nr:phosphoribosyl-ATP pyrophosphohydrolase [Methanomicrobium antiquum]MDD3978276.1 phosphoribosyl-ATP pyrophosphohydrolase [Methanomicrobium sp.]WFN35805.1 phosphoribosyl-ATP pyrophosphohydrolase [Methanomicrobium antiquum]
MELEDSAFLSQIEFKLIEELEEYLESKEPKELADLIEVIYRVAELRGVSQEELEIIRQNKAAERGVFMKNLVLVSVEEEKRDAEEEPGRVSSLCTCEKTDHIFEEE